MNAGQGSIDATSELSRSVLTGSAAAVPFLSWQLLVGLAVLLGVVGILRQ